MNLGDIGWIELITVLATGVLVVGVVLLHYEGLTLIGRLIRVPLLHHRVKILALIFVVLVLHVLEIWIFGLGYYVLSRDPAFGAIAPTAAIGFLDLVYFSAVTFTTVGYGDFVPTGAMRFLTGTEALTGFVLLTWSAAFTFVEMQRYWGRD